MLKVDFVVPPYDVSTSSPQVSTNFTLGAKILAPLK